MKRSKQTKNSIKYVTIRQKVNPYNLYDYLQGDRSHITKSMDWFLYDRDFRHERVQYKSFAIPNQVAWAEI